MVSVIKVTGEEEAIRVENDTEYGLSSAVFSRKSLQVKAGMTHVNDRRLITDRGETCRRLHNPKDWQARL